MRRAGIHMDLVLDAGLVQALVELLHLVDRDRLVLAAEQPQHRTLDLGPALERPGGAEALAGQDAVEADHARKLVGEPGAAQEREETAEAEADAHHGP